MNLNIRPDGSWVTGRGVMNITAMIRHSTKALNSPEAIEAMAFIIAGGKDWSEVDILNSLKSKGATYSAAVVIFMASKTHHLKYTVATKTWGRKKDASRVESFIIEEITERLAYLKLTSVNMLSANPHLAPNSKGVKGKRPYKYATRSDKGVSKKKNKIVNELLA